MVTFQTNVINKSADEIIGCEVTIYSESGDKIESIHIADEKGFKELQEKIDNLEGDFVTVSSLSTTLKNENNSDAINAGLLNGKKSDYYAIREHSHGDEYLSNSHAIERAGKDNYSHVRLIDNLTTTSYQNGEALSAHQGKVLNDKITAITPNIEKKQLHSKFELVKNGNSVTLIINDYKFGAVPADGLYHGILNIPAPYKPIQSTLNKLYIFNQHGNSPRLRINTETSQIEYMFSTGSTSEGQSFDGVLTYTCDPNRE